MARQSDIIKRRIVESCPVGVYEYNAGVVEVVRPQNCIFCEECKKVED
jgi:NAD-dependent dihydropyrimidine dehydrogenase PreA subunit